MKILGIDISFRILLWNQAFFRRCEFYCSVFVFIVFATDKAI